MQTGMPASAAICALMGVLLLCACGEPARDTGRDDPRREPARAVKGFTVAPGLAVTLFASEPVVTNPTNMAIDTRGRVWVCEAVNYRPDYNPHHEEQPSGDRIVILEDTTRDGRADVRTVFYEGSDIDAALGIALAGDSVIVSASPNVLVFIDADGDDRPERKEVLFSGIGGLQDDHGVHALVFGPDGRWYFSFGNAGSQLLHAGGDPVRDPLGRRIEAMGAPFRQGMALRFSTGTAPRYEVLGHNFRNPYELAVDAFGTVWQSDNDDDGNRAVRINYVMDYGNFGYRDELTGAHWSVRRTGMHLEVPLRHWHLNDPGVVPNMLQTGAGSPTGITVYEGVLLPAEFHNAVIHADAGPGVVRAYVPAPEGAGYAAAVAEILASPADRWFRPSDVAVAPDGSLFVADWYDGIVGGNQAVDQQRGRIYRLAPPGASYDVREPNFAHGEAAAVALMSPNPATRFRAYAALRRIGEKIFTYVGSYRAAGNPRHVARALWALGTLSGDPSAAVDLALQSGNPDLRVMGVRLARQRGGTQVPLVRRLVRDASPAVRREAVLSLRHAPQAEAATLWAALAVQHDGTDRWYLEALGIGAEGQWDRYFAAWLSAVGDGWRTPGGRDIVWRSRAAAAAPMLVQLIADSSIGVAERDRYFRALDFHPSERKTPLFGAVVRGAQGDRATVLHRALLHLADPAVKPDVEVRAAIDELLRLNPGAHEFLDVVERFSVDSQEAALLAMALDTTDAAHGRRAARLLVEIHGVVAFEEALGGVRAPVVVARLGAVGSPAAALVLEGIVLDTEAPNALRKGATIAMASGGPGQARLLELIAGGHIPVAHVDAVRAQLLNVWDVRQRKAAEAVLGVPQDGDAKALPPLRSLLAARGDAGRGRNVFQLHCSQCHSTGVRSAAFGPGLGDIGAKLSRAALFEAILYPSAGISMGFEGVAISTQDGTQRVGYVLDETPEAVRLRTADGQTHRLGRPEVVSREPLAISLMPALQQQMTRDELIDLVEYLSSLGGD